MQLYVGNGTKRIQLFYYCIPGAGYRGPIPIPIDGQQPLPDELPEEVIDAIIQHHSPYGFVAENEIDRLRREHVSLLCYSLDTPIKSEKIKRLVAHNEAILTGRGKRRCLICSNISSCSELASIAPPIEAVISASVS